MQGGAPRPPCQARDVRDHWGLCLIGSQSMSLMVAGDVSYVCPSAALTPSRCASVFTRHAHSLAGPGQAVLQGLVAPSWSPPPLCLWGAPLASIFSFFWWCWGCTQRLSMLGRSCATELYPGPDYWLLLSGYCLALGVCRPCSLQLMLGSGSCHPHWADHEAGTDCGTSMLWDLNCPALLKAVGLPCGCAACGAEYVTWTQVSPEQVSPVPAGWPPAPCVPNQLLHPAGAAWHGPARGHCAVPDPHGVSLKGICSGGHLGAWELFSEVPRMAVLALLPGSATPSPQQTSVLLWSSGVPGVLCWVDRSVSGAHRQGLERPQSSSG